MRRAFRKDKNHREVGDYLREMGWLVLDLAQHGQSVDYVVGMPQTHTCALLEVKDGTKPPSARKLTPEEQKLKDNWEGLYLVATSAEDAQRQLEILEAR